MKISSVVLLCLAFLLALVYGAQTAEWSWGPALLALALAVGAASFGKGEGGGRLVGIAMLPIAVWILYRGANSEVLDFARADAMLLLVVFAVACVVGRLRPSLQTAPLLFAGLALVSAINLSIAVVQSQSPDFMWPYHHRPSDRATGFFGHYNYFANYTLVVGLLLAARGFFSKDHHVLRFCSVGVAVWSGAMVVVSGSRGGTLALALGILLLTGCAGVLAWRRGAWWSKGFLVLFPLLLVGAGFAGTKLLSGVLERRGGGDLNLIMDNSARLEWFDLAVRVAGDHPLTGGGSRAFSWERNRHWKVEEFSKGDENERFVHNELLQMLTDYGAVGVVLVLLPIGIVGWLALSRLFLGSGDEGAAHLDAVAAGVLAAGGAMLLQANVSFVFHLLPSTMLLGLLLGMGFWLMEGKQASRWTPVIGGILAACLLWLGIRATRSFERVWPVLYAETSLVRIDPETAIARLEEAAAVWPGHRFFEQAGHHARLAASEFPDHAGQWNHRAAGSYRSAAVQHPHHPGIELNLANTLSELGEDAAAGMAYRRAIELQGGLEGAFAARYYYAKHLYELWHRRWTEDRRASEALWHFLQIRVLLDEAKEQAGWGAPEREKLRDQVEDAIAFLESAKVTPQAPGSQVKD